MFKGKTNALKAILCFIAAVSYIVALVSYDSLDASLNRASGEELNNAVGRMGAVIADLSMQVFGLASFSIGIALLIWARRYYREDNVPLFAIRLTALVGFLVGVSTLLYFIDPPQAWPLLIGIGGIVGNVVGNFLVPLVGVYGAVVVSLLSIIFLAHPAFAIQSSDWQGVLSVCMVVTGKLIKIVSAIQKLLMWPIKKLIGKQSESIDIAVPKKRPVARKVPISSNVEYVAPKPKKKPVARQQKLKLSPDDFDLPDVKLLMPPDPSKQNTVNQSSLEQNAKLLKKVLNDFGVQGEITKVRPGPVVTLYELEPSPGTKSSRVIGLADDIARSMSSVSARISVVPGRNVLGIELPNSNRETVFLRELLETEDYLDERIKLPVALGKDIGGELIMTDLARMPHLLVAGTTGSGKSVAVNAMILSLIYRLSPDECKFIMIDPKMLELSVYEGIPHLLAPVVTEPSKAVVALKWAVREMEQRYRAMSHMGVRNIAGYNKRIDDAMRKGENIERKVQTGFDPETGEPVFENQALEMKHLPFIVIIVDEMADLMLTAGKDIEQSIQRLAQMARAAGIHMVMATQRPSVDVITGVIKANFPTRISFQVTSRIDSRTILGEMGAEQLLGMGDMLYMAGGSRITRVHGPFVDDKEVDEVVNHLKAQGEPDYVEEVTKEDESDAGGDIESTGDELYDQAVAIVLRDRKASTSYVQRQLKIGYNRAANIIEKMEEEGIISQAGSAGKREILVN